MSSSSSCFMSTLAGPAPFRSAVPKPSSRTFVMAAALALPPNPREIRMSSTTVREEVTHSMPPEKLEVFRSLEGWAEENILTFLKPVEASWQPQDFLPDPSSDGFSDTVSEMRERAAGIPDEYMVCLVGNMITEEALPTYQSVFNTFDGVRDETGASPTPWATWTRQWSAEENRHGDLLNKYLYLSGRLDMRQVEKTIHYLIASGMKINAENNPYQGFVYTSFQERATFISHGNTARHAKEHGDVALAKICGSIAADEKRHEMAYTKIIDKLFEVDPDTTMHALADMMRKRIVMPAHMMFDGQDPHLFHHYSAVAQRVGVYTAKDYVDILEFFIKRWNVDKVTDLSDEGRRDQDYVCGLPPRMRIIHDRIHDKAKKPAQFVPFSWVHNRRVAV